MMMNVKMEEKSKLRPVARFSLNDDKGSPEMHFSVPTLNRLSDFESTAAGNLCFNPTLSSTRPNAARPKIYEQCAVQNRVAIAVQKCMVENRRNPAVLPEAGQFVWGSKDILRHIKTAATFVGQVLLTLPHGWGMLIFPSGAVVEGFFIEGKPRQHLIYFMLDGSWYEGQLNSELRQDGEGTLHMPNGSSIHTTTWLKGAALSEVTELFPDHSVSFKGKRSEEGAEGACLFGRKDFILEGIFKGGIATGQIKKNYMDGRKYVGAIDKDLLEEGVGLLMFIDGRKFEGPFSRGVPNGQGTFTSDLGKPSIQVWRWGKKV